MTASLMIDIEMVRDEYLAEKAGQRRKAGRAKATKTGPRTKAGRKR